MKRNQSELSSKALNNLGENLDNLHEHLVKCNDDFVTYVAEGTTVAQRNKLQVFTNSFTAALAAFTQLNDIYNEIKEKHGNLKAAEIELPFPDDGFNQAWVEWKEYLIEQFSIKLSSRAEKRQLYFLNLYSKGKVDRAISIIWYSMHKLYHTLYNYTDKELKGNANSKRIDDGEY